MATATAEVRRFEREEVGLAPEDRVRAALYGLLANLYYSPPSAELLRAILDADVIAEDGSDAELVASWRALKEAARSADPEAVREEYDTAFISTGRPPVLLYASYYTTGQLVAVPLTRLRQELAALGLDPKPASHEPEDHISGLCDAMRFLIAGDGAKRPAPLAKQREFFERHIEPWYGALCEAIASAQQTAFYKTVARFTRAFFDLEAQSFEFGR